MPKDDHGIDIEEDTALETAEEEDIDEDDEEEIEQARQKAQEAAQEAEEKRRLNEEDAVREEHAEASANPDAHRDEEPFQS